MNTTDWTTNLSWAERCGNTVNLHVTVVGVPVKDKVIMYGLPGSLGAIVIYNGTGGNPSQIHIGGQGILKVSSSGTSDTQIISCSFTYFCK